MNSPHSAGLQGNTIVIVDDEPLLLLLMEDIVEELGFTPQPFKTADDALAFLLKAHKEVRLVLTDFSMPGILDGGQLATIVTDRFPGIPIILTSGLLDNAYKSDPRVAFLSKPWALNKMTALISKLAGKPEG